MLEKPIGLSSQTRRAQGALCAGFCSTSCPERRKRRFGRYFGPRGRCLRRFFTGFLILQVPRVSAPSLRRRAVCIDFYSTFWASDKNNAQNLNSKCRNTALTDVFVPVGGGGMGGQGGPGGKFRGAFLLLNFVYKICSFDRSRAKFPDFRSFVENLFLSPVRSHE